MSTVQAVIDRKGSQVHSIGPQASALDGAVLMNDNRIGALVVCEQERVCGMFTERDVLRRVVAHREDPARLRVAEVMSREVVVCGPRMELEEVRRIFQQRRIRHLPVVDRHGRLVGMVSIGDLNAWELDGQEVKIQALEQYLYGQS